MKWKQLLSKLLPVGCGFFFAVNWSGTSVGENKTAQASAKVTVPAKTTRSFGRESARLAAHAGDLQDVPGSVVAVCKALLSLSEAEVKALIADEASALPRELLIAATAFTHPGLAEKYWEQVGSDTRAMMALGLAETSPEWLLGMMGSGSWNPEWDASVLMPMLLSGRVDIAAAVVSQSKALNGKFPETVWNELAELAPARVMKMLASGPACPAPAEAWAALTSRYPNKRTGAQVAALLNGLKLEEIAALTVSLKAARDFPQVMDQALRLAKFGPDELEAAGLGAYSTGRRGEGLAKAGTANMAADLSGVPNSVFQSMAKQYGHSREVLGVLLANPSLSEAAQTALAIPFIKAGGTLPENTPALVRLALAAKVPGFTELGAVATPMDSVFADTAALQRSGISPPEGLLASMDGRVPFTDRAAWQRSQAATVWEKDPTLLRALAMNLPAGADARGLLEFLAEKEIFPAYETLWKPPH